MHRQLPILPLIHPRACRAFIPLLVITVTVLWRHRPPQTFLVWSTLGLFQATVYDYFSIVKYFRTFYKFQEVGTFGILKSSNKKVYNNCPLIALSKVTVPTQTAN